MATEKVYTRVTEAEEMVKKLCEKQPDVLWCVKPEIVAVYGIENKERSEKNKTLAKIKTIKGSEKFVMLDNNIPIRYLIEIYWSDFREWNEKQKQWILFHELLHIHHEAGTIKHDVEDFALIVEKVGPRWYKRDDLPDLINGDVKFDLSLRPSMEDVEERTKDEIEEETEEKKDEKETEKDKKTGDDIF